MESECIRGTNWKLIHAFPEKTRQKIKPCIETSAHRREGKDSGLSIRGARAQAHGSSFNLPFRTQIIPGKCEKCSRIQAFTKMNADLQMNSERMERL